MTFEVSQKATARGPPKVRVIGYKVVSTVKVQLNWNTGEDIALSAFFQRCRGQLVIEIGRKDAE